MVTGRIFKAGLLVFLAAQISFSQRAASADYSDTSDSSDTTQNISASDEPPEIEVRLLSEEKIRVYKSDPEFNYDISQPENEDWITKLKSWINRQLSGIVSSETYLTAMDYFYYFLMILALILIIRGLIKADRRGLTSGKVNSQILQNAEHEEDLTAADFDELVKTAVGSKNYRLAVRYLYLKSLHQLADRGFIELKDNKTNYQYLSEIKSSGVAAAFQRATRLFEQAWYGEFPVDENLLNSSRTEFQELFGLIAVK